MKLKNANQYHIFNSIDYVYILKNKWLIKLISYKKIYKPKSYLFLYFFHYLLKNNLFQFDLLNNIIVNKNISIRKVYIRLLKYTNTIIKIFYIQNLMSFRVKNWFLNKSHFTTARINKNIKKFSHSNFEINSSLKEIRWLEFINHQINCKKVFKKLLELSFVSNSKSLENIINYCLIKYPIFMHDTV